MSGIMLYICKTNIEIYKPIKTKKTMKTTKSEIIKKTRTKKGQGFNPDYSFNTVFENCNFEKPMWEVEVYVITPCDFKNCHYKVIGYADTKKQYIQTIFDYLNN
jgi:hypothetical protein